MVSKRSKKESLPPKPLEQCETCSLCITDNERLTPDGRPILGNNNLK